MHAICKGLIVNKCTCGAHHVHKGATLSSVSTVDQISPSLIRIYTVCHSLCIVWTHYYMVDPISPNFRVIITNVLGVPIFRKFTVIRFTVASHYIELLKQILSSRILSEGTKLHRKYPFSS